MNDFLQREEDGFYKRRGVKPPERISHGIKEEDIDSILEKNLQGHKCKWVQEGSRIYCQEGEYEHGKQIGTQVYLDGTGKKGQPLLKPLKPILRTDK